jgi:hypothetical protein
VPYAPIDGPDSRFGQLNRPLSDEAYKAAGIEGFLPPQNFKPDFKRRVRFSDDIIPPAAEPSTTSNLLVNFDDPDLHFPTLAELNAELDIWDEKEIKTWVDELTPVDSTIDQTLQTQVMSPLPTAARLASRLVSSNSKLFFISWSLPGCAHREWQLVRVNLAASISHNPECLHNGRFIVEFFICHPNDHKEHPLNQRWWLKYHAGSSTSRLQQGDYQILRPDDNSAAYAKQHNLFPFCQWVTLLNDANFIHGPFEFAVINGRATRDRISEPDWNQLILANSKYDDAPPDLSKRCYKGVQYSRNFHTSITDTSVRNHFVATHFLLLESYFAAIMDL